MVWVVGAFCALIGGFFVVVAVMVVRNVTEAHAWLDELARALGADARRSGSSIRATRAGAVVELTLATTDNADDGRGVSTRAVRSSRRTIPSTYVRVTAVDVPVLFTMWRRGYAGSRVGLSGDGTTRLGDVTFDDLWALEAAPVEGARQLFDPNTRIRISALHPFLLSGGDGRIELEVHRYFERPADALAAIDLLLEIATRAASIGLATSSSDDAIAELAEARRLRSVRRIKTIAVFAAVGLVFAVVLAFMGRIGYSMLTQSRVAPTPAASLISKNRSPARASAVPSARSAASSVDATPSAPSR
ncbi:MAG: hypothetical protein ACHREM_17410 [Polyangiales bacterium]